MKDLLLKIVHMNILSYFCNNKEVACMIGVCEILTCINLKKQIKNEI